MSVGPDWFASLTALAVPYALVLATPGPNLLVIVRASLMWPARGVPAAAIGIACGATLAAIAAALGAAFMPSSHGFELGGRLVFACLLGRAGVQSLCCNLRAEPGAPSPGGGAHGQFRLGLLAALSNPLTLPFFGAFFLAQASAGDPAKEAAFCAVVFLMAGGWFGLLGLLLSHPRCRMPMNAARRRLEPAVGLGLVCYAVVTLWPALRG